jgi:hypothetical protein
VGEFQTFSSEAFATLLSEARKSRPIFASSSSSPISYRIQRDTRCSATQGSLVAFRVGSREAELLAPEFRPMESGAQADQEPFTA